MNQGAKRWLTDHLPPAFKYPNFRLYWFGMLASVGGFQMLRAVQGWIAFEQSGSALDIGYVWLANGIPAIFLNLFGGLAAGGLAVVTFALGAPLFSRRVRRLDSVLADAEAEQLAANQEAENPRPAAND